jgi:hypothetical protein
MGEDSKGIAASEGSDGIGSCQTQHVGISPQKDRGCSKGTVGEGEGGEEEGGIELWTRRENDSSHLQTEEEAYAACNRSSSASF